MTGEQKPGGLEVVAWRFRFIGPKGRVWSVQKNKPAWYRDDQDTILEPLTPAEPAEARIRDLEALLERANATATRAINRADLVEVQCAHKATAAEAKLARAVEGLKRIGYGDGGIGTHRAIAQQTLAALQQEGG